MANNFVEDISCIAFWDFESGALDVDSRGRKNTLYTDDVVANVTSYKRGAASADFERSNTAYFSLLSYNANVHFPLIRVEDEDKLLSVAFWFNVESVQVAQSTYLLAFGRGDMNTRSFAVYLGPSSIKVANGYNGGASWEVYDTLYTLSLGQWYHIGIAHDGVNKTLTIRLWDETGATATTFTHTWTNETNVENSVFSLGIELTTSSNCYDGLMDEAVVFDRLLSVDEFDDIRSNVYAPPEGLTERRPLPYDYSAALRMQAGGYVDYSNITIEPNNFELLVSCWVAEPIESGRSIRIDFSAEGGTSQALVRLDIDVENWSLSVTDKDGVSLASEVIANPIPTGGLFESTYFFEDWWQPTIRCYDTDETHSQFEVISLGSPVIEFAIDKGSVFPLTGLNTVRVTNRNTVPINVVFIDDLMMRPAIEDGPDPIPPEYCFEVEFDSELDGATSWTESVNGLSPDSSSGCEVDTDYASSYSPIGSLKMSQSFGLEYVDIPGIVADSFRFMASYRFGTATGTGEDVVFTIQDNGGNSKVIVSINNDDVTVTVVNSAGTTLLEDTVENPSPGIESWHDLAISSHNDTVIVNIDNLEVVTVQDPEYNDILSGIDSFSIENLNAPDPMWVDSIIITNVTDWPT